VEILMHLETRGAEHARTIVEALTRLGIEVNAGRPPATT
jgi:hypothetical protein